MANLVDLKFVSELFDGRFFLIPAYQRGYRWESKQVEYLLRDLYSFYLSSGSNDFYCLQPVIIQKVSNQNTINDVENTCGIKVNNCLNHDDELKESLNAVINATNTIQEHTLWEVVDGQQRLTTIYILYRYLLSVKYNNDLKKFSQFNRKTLYSLYYESRPNSFQFINDICGSLSPQDIDETYMKKAYETIDNWILNESAKIIEFEGKTPNDIIDGLFNLINGNATSKSVKVIWYEIDSSKPNIIKEFLDVNTGKIGLTDSELIKALFLQNRGNTNSVDQIALEWERIENLLNQSDFWAFLCNKEKEQHKRIGLILDIMYDVSSPSISSKEDHYLFDYYYNNVFSQLSSITDKVKFVEDEWHKIVECVRTLEDWYYNPAVYNYVGYLTEFNTSISEIYRIFNEISIVGYDDFIERLTSMAKNKIRKLKVQDGLIANKYGEPVIKRILLFANINQLNKQFEMSGRICSQIYRFPFDVYQSQKWNVEHIDSQTANEMKEKQEQKDWISAAEKAFPNLLEDEDYLEVKQSEDLKQIILYIQRGLEEDTDDKDSIGNLALLDAKTNDSYGNSIFVQKREIIAKKIKEGQFVPLCTQWAFNKHFTNDTVPDLTRWTKKDKDNYNRFILDNIK